MANPDLVAVGMCGNLLEIWEALEASYRITAILDDNPALQGTAFEGVPIRPMAEATAFPDARFLFLIGSERTFRIRHEIVARLGLPASRFATVVHPSAAVSRFATLGHGVGIYAGAVVTSNAVIGEHVLILPQTVVHHDVTIGACSLVGSGCILAGGVQVGERCYIGSGSRIRPGITVGGGSLVGMGAVVTRDVAPGSVVAGVPARPV
ncbi:acetyltransferase [Tropicimonas isoalkanivorans]|uniref:Sugar O-acyltransferase, sialic acid O-acetyltransferase NeuD family n=1 Tax=Tropicimonas isoalkanivorans TaxID=441112 RepID=A0A1I1LLQ0_9RHOB|nr:acetyltransferase [Tropicimonas isoalkanivorans]SFC73876.1 sugar O-acyltransferase, sialic acid O-acetyltransferase NeuD family [Tropicimonas isoalkanivorans]